jgi:hypothetical protein
MFFNGGLDVSQIVGLERNAILQDSDSELPKLDRKSEKKQIYRPCGYLFLVHNKIVFLGRFLFAPRHSGSFYRRIKSSVRLKIAIFWDFRARGTGLAHFFEVDSGDSPAIN